MKTLADFLLSLAERSTVDTVGWLLLHSLWQFTSIAPIVVILLRMLRRQTAALRYHLLLATLGLMLVVPIATWSWLRAGLRDGVYLSSIAATGASDKSSGESHGDGDSTAPERRNDGPDDMPLGFADDPRHLGGGPISGASPTTLPSHTRAESGGDETTFAASLTAAETVEAAESVDDFSGNREDRNKTNARSWFGQLATSMRPWLPIIVIAWGVGMLVCSVRPMIGWHALRRIRRDGVSPVPPTVQRLFVATIERLGVRRSVQVLQSAIVHAPVVAGYFKPFVLLPTSIISEMPMQQLEAILAHELAHVRRVDYVVNLFQTLFETVFFYHPAVWWISKQIRTEREHCCDDIVVSALDNRADYGRALLAVTQMRKANSTLAVGVGGSALLTRVRRLWGIEPTERSRGSVLVCCMVLAAGVFAATLTWQAVANEKKPASEDPIGDEEVVEAEKAEKAKPLKFKVVDQNGREIKGPVELHVPHVGYSLGAKRHRVLTTDDSGEIELENLKPGTHSLVTRQFDGATTTILAIDLPNDKETITARMAVPHPAGLAMPELTFHVNSHEARQWVYFELANNNRQNKPITLRDSDLCFTSQNWRVFLPKKLRVGGQVIESRKKLSVSLDWTTIVTEGLWLSRAFEDIREPWPAALPAEGNDHFRVFIGNSGSNTFELPAPENVLRRLDAQKKAATSISLAKQTYFIGEHIPMHYVVKNNGDVPFVVSWGGDSRAPRPLRFKIVATGKGGRVEDPFPNPYCMGGLGSAVTVEPGGEYDMGKLAMQSYCRFSKPGKYRVQAYHDLGWVAGNRYIPDSPIALEKNEIPTNPSFGPVATTNIEIKTPSVKDARAVIQQLRQDYKDAYYTSQVFSNLQVNAYLPALVEWIDENGGMLGADDERRESGLTMLPATTGIGSIHTPEATKLMIELLTHHNPEVAFDASQKLTLRLPRPDLEKRKDENASFALMHHLNKQTWREEFREPLLTYALSVLPTGFASGEEATPETLNQARENQILGGGILQAVAKQDDYPVIRDVLMKVVREYRDNATEQNEYPRPRTVSRAALDALWYSFCDGNLEYDPGREQRGHTFKTNDLEQLFENNEIDPFTVVRLLGQVESFRPDGWRGWVKMHLRSDVPWIRAHVMNQMTSLVEPEFEASIATNIENVHHAVQVAALGLVHRAPSVHYIPALRRAANSTDKWIKPLAESALQTCLKFEKEEKSRKASEKKSSDQAKTIQATKTWKNLLDQPAITLEQGNARLGVENHRGSVGSGVLLYCFTSEYQRPASWEEPNRIGPFSVEVSHERDGDEVVVAGLEAMKVAEEAPLAKALFRYQIKLERPGKHRVTVKTLDGKTVGTTEIVAEEASIHPWMPFGFVPLGLFELDEQFDGVGRVRNMENGTAVPAVNGMEYLVYQAEDAEPRYRVNDLLPTLQPTAGSLSVKSIDDKLVIESRYDMTLSWPTEHFLARWWVNDEPFMPEPEADLAKQLSGQVITGKSLLLGLECDPRRLGAQFGDKIELQLMYTANGWEYSQSNMDSLQAAEPEKDAPEVLVSNRVQIVAPHVFSRFETTFENRFGNQVPTRVVIDGAGNVQYHSDADDRLRVKARDVKFKLPPKLLEEFVATLGKSKWLKASVDQKRSLRTHPTTYELHLVRNGDVQAIKFEDGEQDDLKPYRSLIRFLGRLHRQEDTLRKLDPEEPEREMTLLFLNNELRELHGHRHVQKPYLPILDWNRLVPTMRETLEKRDRVNRSDLVAAIRTMSHMKDEKAWDDIIWHFRNVRMYSKNMATPVRDALVDAIVAYGGQRSVDLLAEDVAYFHVSAWGLIRCGDVAVPTIVRIIENGPGPATADIRYEKMFRTYLIHWNELPTPVDPRVVAAVRASMNHPWVKKYRTQHHQEFLDKVEASQRRVWGKEVDGVSVHLRALQDKWPFKHAVKLSSDVRNEGIRNASFYRSAWSQALEGDGQIYRADDDAKTATIAPGRAKANIDFEITKRWVSEKDGKPLEPAVGKHTIRLHYTVHANGRAMTITSNTIEIELTP